MEPNDWAPEGADSRMMPEGQFVDLMRRIALGQVPEHLRIPFINLLRGRSQDVAGQPGAGAPPSTRYGLADVPAAFNVSTPPALSSQALWDLSRPENAGILASPGGGKDARDMPVFGSLDPSGWAEKDQTPPGLGTMFRESDVANPRSPLPAGQSPASPWQGLDRSLHSTSTRRAMASNDVGEFRGSSGQVDPLDPRYSPPTTAGARITQADFTQRPASPEEALSEVLSSWARGHKMRDADNGTSAVVRGTAEERPNGQIVVSNGTVIFVPRNGSFPRMMTVSGLDTLTIEPDGWVTFQRGI